MEETTQAPAATTPAPQPGMGAFPSLMGPFTLFSHAWKTFKSHWKTLVGIQLIPAVIAIAFAALSLVGMAARGSNAGLGALAAILSLVFVIAMIIATIWSTVALLIAVRDSHENIGVGEAYKRAKGKLGSYFWISLIVGFVTFGGAILLIIPGIIFAVWFCLSIYVFISEGDQGMSAMLKSKEYVRGYWWQVFGRMIFIAVILWVIIFVIELILGLLKLQVIASLISGALGLVIAPLAVIYSFRMYQNLREVKGTVTPSQKGKGWFIAIGILGVVGIPLIIIGVISAAIFTAVHKSKSLNDDMMQYQYQLQQPQVDIPTNLPVPTPQ